MDNDLMKRLLRNKMVTSVLSVIVGVMLIIARRSALDGTVRLIGGLMLLGAAAYALFYFIGFFRDRTQLMTAAGCAAAGIIFLSWPKMIVNLFPIIAGVILILNGLSNLAEARRSNGKGTALTAVLVIIGGILIAFHPGFIANAVILCAGIVLTLNGAFDLMMLYQARDDIKSA